MRFEITGEAVESAHWKVLFGGVSLLLINTKEKWHYFDTVGCNTFDKTIDFDWWYDESKPEGHLKLISETDEEADIIQRLRYSLHEKDQIEIMFIDEDLL